MIIGCETLKSCPFCGSDPVLSESYRYITVPDEMWKVYSVLCSDESCIMHQEQKFYRTEESARKAWNKREKISTTINDK